MGFGPGTESYEIIMAGVTSVLAAQMFKLFTNALRGNRLNFRILTQTGGMPSSHSAGMTAMATSVGLVNGFGSSIFAVAFGIAAIVMYDAAGLRQAAGRMAGILNRLTEDLYSDHPDRVPARLRELLGHTPVEVLAGGGLGVAVSWLYHIRLLASGG